MNVKSHLIKLTAVSAIGLMILAGCGDNEAYVTIRCIEKPISACVDDRCSEIGTRQSYTWTVKWDRKSIFSRGDKEVYLYAEDALYPENNMGKWVILEDNEHYWWDIFGWDK